MPQLWEIVGGSKKNGVIARTGKDLSSKRYARRIPTGTLVEELELIGERLHFKLVEGAGPAEGWVTITLNDEPLLEKTNKKPADRGNIISMEWINWIRREWVQLPCALLFPGQGSQYVTMLSDLRDDPVVQTYRKTAKEILGYDLMDLCVTGPDSFLCKTKFCQPAMFLAGMAGMEKFRATNPENAENPGCVAGFSVGEYTALCVAGVFTFEQGLQILNVRGNSMQKAADDSPQQTLMVIGLQREQLEEICQEHTAGSDIAVVSTVCFPKGFACSGTKDAITKMKDACMKAGAAQAQVLKTNVAFHSPLMNTVRVEVQAALMKMLPDMKPPKCNVYMNCTGRKIEAGTPPREIVPLLGKQLTDPVLWEPSVRMMIEDGINEFYEIGPMKALKAMMKQINPKMWKKTTNIDV